MGVALLFSAMGFSQKLDTSLFQVASHGATGDSSLALISLPEDASTRTCYRLLAIASTEDYLSATGTVQVRFEGAGLAVLLTKKHAPEPAWVRFTITRHFHLFPYSRQWPSRGHVAEMVCAGASLKSIDEHERSSSPE
jgi:hypothetical protein